MREIEKADVDISKLFNWGRKFSFEFNNKKYSVYIRLVGDAELNRARVFALRKSAELRKTLQDLNSDDRLAYISPKESLTKDDIIDALLIGYAREFATDATRDLKFNLPKEPDSDSTLEDREKYQKEIDEYPEKRMTEIKKYVDERLAKTRKTLEKDSVDVLYKRYVDTVTNQLCEIEMISKFREMCTFYGIYKDKDYSQRMFSSFEQFENLPKIVKEQFMEFYNDLDMDTDTLKKSLGVVQ